MRITGLTSGMDIDSMVKGMMTAQQTKIDQLNQKKELNTWTSESYSEMNKTLANFILDSKKDLGLTDTTTGGSVVNKSVSSLDWVKKAIVSDSDVAEASVQADAAAGSYQVKVNSLAAGWSAASSTAISGSNDKSNLKTQFGLAAGDKIDFTLTTDQGAIVVNSTTVPALADLGTVSMSDITTYINAQKKGLTANYDSTADRFFLQNSKTGAASTASFMDNSSVTIIGVSGKKFLSGSDSALKMQTEASASLDLSGITTYSGTDADIDFGAAKNIKNSSNTFTLNSITFNLKKTTPTSSITVNVSTDVDGVYNKIKSFVDKYNSLLDTAGTKMNETRYKDYLPLTDAQREKMSDTQVTQWEVKGKSGLLRNDSILSQTMQNTRTGLYAAVQGVTGAFDQLTKIGIATQSYTSGAVGGKLTIDKQKLTDAIAKDADGVLNLFFKQPSSALQYKSESTMTAAEIQQKSSESGLVTRLYDNLISGMKQVVNKAGVGDNASTYGNVSSTFLLDFVVKQSSISVIDKANSDYTKRISDLNTAFTTTENRYYKQFSAMESAMNKMNQQSSWLSQQLGGSQ